MSLKIFAGSANLPMAEAVIRRLGLEPGKRILQRFPDGETRIEVLENVRGDDVYIIQPTGPPVGEHLLELLLLADACRRAGASRTTAVVPYFGYARQDRRASGREPLSARLVADLMKASGLERVVAVDLHTASLEGCFAIPLEHLSAVATLAEEAHAWVGDNPVIVSPDLGAVNLAERYARLLHLPLAIVHKTRVSGTEVSVRSLTGEVRGHTPIVVDDMISTAGTVEAAIKALLAAGCLPEATVVVSHALLVGPARERLGSLPIRRLLTTDSLEVSADFPVPLQVVSLASLLSDAIGRLYANQPLGELVTRG